MRNFKSSVLSAFSLMLIMTISSCSVIKNNDFAKQKYTNFRNGETVFKHRAEGEKKIKLKNFSEAPEKNISDITLIASSDNSIILLNTSEPAINSCFINETYDCSIIADNNYCKNRLSIKKHKNESLRFAGTAYVAETDPVLLVILAIIIPPLAVYLVDGIGSLFWLDLVLTLFFWIPGVVLALLVVFGIV